MNKPQYYTVVLAMDVEAVSPHEAACVAYGKLVDDNFESLQDRSKPSIFQVNLAENTEGLTEELRYKGYQEIDLRDEEIDLRDEEIQQRLW